MQRPDMQHDNARNQDKGGTGLGLVITKRLAELLGGDVAVTLSQRAATAEDTRQLRATVSRAPAAAAPPSARGASRIGRRIAMALYVVLVLRAALPLSLPFSTLFLLMTSAAREAKFAVSGVNLGLFCSTPSVALSRNLGRKAAFEMLVTGEFVSAAEAMAKGLAIYLMAAIGLLAGTALGFLAVRSFIRRDAPGGR